MPDFEFFDHHSLTDPALPADFHLPLDWNEDLSLEDYLERLERAKDQ